MEGVNVKHLANSPAHDECAINDAYVVHADKEAYASLCQHSPPTQPKQGIKTASTTQSRVHLEDPNHQPWEWFILPHLCYYAHKVLTSTTTLATKRVALKHNCLEMRLWNPHQCPSQTDITGGWGPPEVFRKSGHRNTSVPLLWPLSLLYHFLRKTTGLTVPRYNVGESLPI